MKNKIFNLISVGLLAVLLFPMIAGAQASPPDAQDPFVVIDNVVDFFFAFLMAAVVILVLFAAFTFLSAAGDPESITKARTMLMYAGIGVAVALLSKSIVPIMRTILGTP